MLEHFNPKRNVWVKNHLETFTKEEMMLRANVAMNEFPLKGFKCRIVHYEIIETIELEAAE
jgi:hypothetical protein